jgi:hypothetical protein
MTPPAHEVTNQAPPPAGYNAFEADRPLVEAVEREGPSGRDPNRALLMYLLVRYFFA